MIIRFVKMTFQPDRTAEFEKIFFSSQPEIRRFEGCRHVQLLNDTRDPNIYFTVSHWDSEEHLEQYRTSSFFRQTWSRVKPMFSSRAEAWSLVPPQS
jgi:heme oxygenase (mycobilin-producing)